jgi:archaellum biogenesis protein FlaJ (TadC family)
MKKKTEMIREYAIINAALKLRAAKMKGKDFGELEDLSYIIDFGEDKLKFLLDRKAEIEKEWLIYKDLN